MRKQNIFKVRATFYHCRRIFHHFKIQICLKKLKVSWVLLLLACVKDIDDNKLMVLYYMTPISREIYPFLNFEDAQCLTDFRIKTSDIFRLNKCLQLSENIACSQTSTFVSIKELCIFLNRLSYPCSTGSDPTEVYLIFIRFYILFSNIITDFSNGI